MLTSADVLQARFTATTFREGYEQGAVTAIVDRVGSALAAWERPEGAGAPASASITGDELAGQRIPVTKFAQGVDQDEVDVLLEGAVAALRHHEAAAAAAAAARLVEAPPVSAPADPSAVLRSSALADARFGTTRFRAGYSKVGVEGFLAAARSAIAEHEHEHEHGRSRSAPSESRLSAEDASRVRFRPTSFRAGYDRDDVDALIHRIVTTLVHHEGSGGSR